MAKMQPLSRLSERVPIPSMQGWLKPVMLFFGVLVIYLRAPVLLLQARFWAEEATVYFVTAYRASWLDGLLNNHIGYFNLWPAFATTLAAHLVPLEQAPLVTTLLAFAAQLFPIAIILFSRSPLWRSHLAKILRILVVLFVPSSYESWLNTVNSQFYFQLSVFLLAVEGVSSEPFQKWFQRFVLAAGGLTGILSLFMFPLFLFRWLVERQKERLVQVLILGACGLVQAASMLAVMSQTEGVVARRFNLTIGVRTAISILWTRTFGLIVTGYDFDALLTPWLYPLVENTALRLATPIVLALFEIFILWLLVSRYEWQQKVIWLGGFVLSFLPSILFAVGSKPKETLIIPGYSPRYFIIPSAIFMLMILKTGLQAQKTIVKVLLWCVLALALFWGMNSFVRQKPYEPGWPVWQQQVSQWRADPASPLQIWPPGWKINLPPPFGNQTTACRCFDAVSACTSISKPQSYMRYVADAQSAIP